MWTLRQALEEEPAGDGSQSEPEQDVWIDCGLAWLELAGSQLQTSKEMDTVKPGSLLKKHIEDHALSGMAPLTEVRWAWWHREAFKDANMARQ